MHELSEALKSTWRFAKWARIESQLLKKLSQFSSLKRSDIDHMTTTFEKKIEILREKFFLSSSQANVSDIAESFISLTVSFNSRITEDEVKQTIRRVKADKASSASDISNRALQTSLAELISVLTSLFNACVTHKYHSKQFKKTQTIVLRKSKKSDYIDSKTYRLIALLNIMSKALKSIMIKRLSDIVETHYMLSNAQIKARCKWFVISTLDLLIDQVHTVWSCEIKYVIFMLSLNVVEAFNRVSHVRLLHTLKMKRTSSYIIEWTRSFLENRETSLIFDEQTSDMREINADISQRFLISSILFLFFNVSLIKKCEVLKIKIEVLDFINNINILVYDRFTEEICRTLSKTHNVCAKWARTHDATFASEKYKLTHFTRKSKRFNMTTSIQIESSVIKSKSDVRVLEMQLNMKLRWDAHLRQIETNHVIRMLTLSYLEVFTKTRQVYSAVVRSEIAFEASVWHQRDKKDELLSKECRLETLQNQTLCHVAEAFKRVNIETVETETYMSSLHVHLNMLQDKITLHSRVNDRTQEIRQACELIRVHLTKVNRVISRSLIIKKIVLLNVFIREDAKIQSRRRRRIFFFTMISTSDSIAITQYHKDQWNQRWEKYRERVADVNAISAQRSHLSNKMIKMRDDFQKAESILAMHIRIERIDLNAYLHSRNVSDMNSSRCDCKWSHQTTKHVLMHCSNWSHLRSRMLQDADFLNYRIIVVITKSLRAVAKMMMKTKLLKQFRVTRTLVF
jgi:tellurite resistance protein